MNKGLLAGSYLQPVVRRMAVGDPEVLETLLFHDVIESLDPEAFRDRPVLIKGCSRVPVPDSAYVHALQRVQGVARSVLFGEACSAVPLYKRK